VAIILATTRLEPEIARKTIIFLYIFLIRWFKLPSDFVKKKKKSFLKMHAIREIEKKLDGLWIFWGLKWMPCFRVNNSESTCLKLLRIRINYTGGFRYICPTSAWIWYLPCTTAPQSSLRVSETIYYTISSYCIKSVCSVLLKYSLFKIWILIKKI